MKYLFRLTGRLLNHKFDNSFREEEYKEILDDDLTKRPTNCHVLAPVDCNSQILDALKIDAKKIDFHMKDVSREFLYATQTTAVS